MNFYISLKLTIFLRSYITLETEYSYIIMVIHFSEDIIWGFKWKCQVKLKTSLGMK
jgi:hypothetical protein